MKVLMINGSPRKHGTTRMALSYISQELASAGIESDIVTIGHKVKGGCVACGHCKRSGTHRCIITDDPVNQVMDQAEAADGLVLASPVHYGGLSGGMKCLMDRMCYAKAALSFKVAAPLVCLRRSGGVDALQSLTNYLSLSSCILVPTPYWSVVHGNRPEDLEKDEEGVMLLRTLGRNMAWMMQMMAHGAEIPLPELVPPARTDFVQK